MQTFLPYTNFEATARCLDNQRLGKQRVEAYMIYGINVRRTLRDIGRLDDPPSKWENHPAVRMWRGYLELLLDYGITICREWIRRGFVDNMLPVFEHRRSLDMNSGRAIIPYWIVEGFLSYSHQSNLVRKNPDHYRQFFPDVPNDLTYHWPVTGYPMIPVWWGFESGRTDVPDFDELRRLVRGE